MIIVKADLIERSFFEVATIPVKMKSTILRDAKILRDVSQKMNDFLLPN